MSDIMKYLKKIKPITWLKSFLYVLLIAFVYQTTIEQLIINDWAREDYSHCYFIPFVVLYLIWEKRAVLASISSSPSWKGLVPLIFGLILYWLGELGGVFYTLFMSLWFVIVGLLWLHLGGQKIKQIGFALFMMLTMFPFPGYINNQILLKLKIISSQLGVVILQLCGMSAYREGNVIDLGFTQLQVVDACSGLRYVMPLMVLSLILAHWFKAAIWKKAVLVLSSLPLAIVVNSFRIAMTGIIYSVWGAAVAESFFHGFSGWLIFIFTLPALLLEMWVLNRGFRGQGLGFRGQETEIGSQESEVRGQEVGIRSLMQPVFITTVVLIITTFVISMGIDSREKIPIKKSFNEFPLSVAEWQGRRQMMERKFLDLLHLSEYIMVNYRNSKGQDIDFYVAYNESQSKGEATHSPETCLPGGGWIFKQSGMVMIPTGNDRTIVVSRAFIEQSGSQELMYFWFPQRGRILTSLYQVKLYSFWDTLTKQRTDGALVRIITPVYGNEGVKDAEARIQEFTKEIVPVLDGFLP